MNSELTIIRTLLRDKLKEDTPPNDVIKFINYALECSYEYIITSYVPLYVINSEKNKKIISGDKTCDTGNIMIPAKNGLSAGIDLYVAEDIQIPNNETIVKISTKISLNGSLLLMPTNTYAWVTGRSSTASRNVIIIAGIIDADYTGEIFIQAYTLKKKGVWLKRGDKIAQMIISSYIPCDVRVFNSLEFVKTVNTIASETRGEKCCGSSGMTYSTKLSSAAPLDNLHSATNAG